MVRTGAAFLFVALAAACGGGPTPANLFASRWKLDEAASLSRVRQRLGVRPVRGADLAVAVVRHGDALAGLPLGPGASWTFLHALDTRPVVAGHVVVGSGGGEVFALDALTGKLLWTRPTGGLPLVGAGDDEEVTVLTFRRGAEGNSTMLAVLRDGTSIRQVESDARLGSPAVVRGLAFVPWSETLVSVLDLSNGDEAGRFTLPSVTHAIASQGMLFFAGKGFSSFDPVTSLPLVATRAPSRSALLATDATEKWTRSNERIAPITLPGTADQVLARPTPAGFDSGLVYATRGRLLMAVDALSGGLTWLRRLDVGPLGGTASSGGVHICDRSGRVLGFTSRGADAGTWDFGQRIDSCVVSTDGLEVVANAGPPSFAESLADALRVADPELVSTQGMLARLLSRLDAPEATRALLTLVEDPALPPVLLKEVTAALVGHRAGVGNLLAIAATCSDAHGSPPIGLLARTLLAMGERRAAGPLAACLTAPSLQDQDLTDLASALRALGSAAQAATVARYLRSARTTVKRGAGCEALLVLARTLSGWPLPKESGFANGADFLASLAKERTTGGCLREGLRSLASVTRPK